MAFLEDSISVLLKNGGYLDITLSYNSADQHDTEVFEVY